MREAKRRLSDDPVLARIMSSLKEAGRTDKELLNHLGMVHGTFDAWKFRNIKSYLTRIDDIAEFLNVSPNYLLRGVDDEVNFETLSEAEIRLIKFYRSSNAKGRTHILECAEYVSKSVAE
ncbi:hypothetical protein IJG71_00605 [Candidatus Saccharibacteria bacterium]|nr:hypothetical protein [Candidatus Saccharibacteria bacterium]